MRSVSSGCFTRVVVDGAEDLEIAELQSVMQRIRQSLRHIPEAQRVYVGNALLNLAVCRTIAEAGSERTATILIRLVDAVLEHEQPPPPGTAVDLLATHS
jgi:hypothetical protein